MAAELMEAEQLTPLEFEELRNVDHAYRRELIYEDSMRLKAAVDVFGSDVQTLVSILLNPGSSETHGLVVRGGSYTPLALESAHVTLIALESHTRPHQSTRFPTIQHTAQALNTN
jgi:hypothetical protein